MIYQYHLLNVCYEMSNKKCLIYYLLSNVWYSVSVIPWQRCLTRAQYIEWSVLMCVVDYFYIKDLENPLCSYTATNYKSLPDTTTLCTISLLLDLVTLNLLYVLVFSYLFYPADFPLSSSLNIETSHITRIIHQKLRGPEHVISRVRWVF